MRRKSRMAKHRTEKEIRQALGMIEVEHCLGMILTRQFKRRRQRLLKAIKKSASAATDTDQGKNVHE